MPVTSTEIAKYARVGTARGLSGAQAAQALLDGAGIHDVRITPARGFLSDHYNPVTKTLALSEQVYASRSVAAVGVAASWDVLQKRPLATLRGN